MSTAAECCPGCGLGCGPGGCKNNEQDSQDEAQVDRSNHQCMGTVPTPQTDQQQQQQQAAAAVWQEEQGEDSLDGETACLFEEARLINREEEVHEEETAAAVKEQQNQKQQAPRCGQGCVCQISSDSDGRYDEGWCCEECGQDGTGGRWYYQEHQEDFCFGCCSAEAGPWSGRQHAPTQEQEQLQDMEEDNLEGQGQQVGQQQVEQAVVMAVAAVGQEGRQQAGQAAAAVAAAVAVAAEQQVREDPAAASSKGRPKVWNAAMPSPHYTAAATGMQYSQRSQSWQRRGGREEEDGEEEDEENEEGKDEAPPAKQQKPAAEVGAVAICKVCCGSNGARGVAPAGGYMCLCKDVDGACDESAAEVQSQSQGLQQVQEVGEAVARIRQSTADCSLVRASHKSYKCVHCGADCASVLASTAERWGILGCCTSGETTCRGLADSLTGLMIRQKFTGCGWHNGRVGRQTGAVAASCYLVEYDDGDERNLTVAQLSKWLVSTRTVRFEKAKDGDGFGMKVIDATLEVVAVEGASAAAGVLVGDQIVAVNRHPIGTTASLCQVVAAADSQQFEFELRQLSIQSRRQPLDQPSATETSTEKMPPPQPKKAARVAAAEASWAGDDAAAGSKRKRELQTKLQAKPGNSGGHTQPIQIECRLAGSKGAWHHYKSINAAAKALFESAGDGAILRAAVRQAISPGSSTDIAGGYHFRKCQRSSGESERAETTAAPPRPATAKASCPRLLQTVDPRLTKDESSGITKCTCGKFQYGVSPRVYNAMASHICMKLSGDAKGAAKMKRANQAEAGQLHGRRPLRPPVRLSLGVGNASGWHEGAEADARANGARSSVSAPRTLRKRTSTPATAAAPGADASGGAAAARMVGRRVSKKFRAGSFHGQVTGYDHKAGFYSVTYEDGDTEELTPAKLRRVLVPVATQPQPLGSYVARKFLDDKFVVRERPSTLLVFPLPFTAFQCLNRWPSSTGLQLLRAGVRSGRELLAGCVLGRRRRGLRHEELGGYGRARTAHRAAWPACEVVAGGEAGRSGGAEHKALAGRGRAAVEIGRRC